FAACGGSIDVESSSETLYFRPLLPASEILYCQESSKSWYELSEMRSKPTSGCPSACTAALGLGRCLIAPCSTVHRPSGMLLNPSACQPLRVRPSKIRVHPTLRSAALRTFGFVCACNVVLASDATAISSHAQVRIALTKWLLGRRLI